MKMRKTFRSLALPAILAASALNAFSAETVLFSDNFEGDTSDKWTLFQASGNDVPDYNITWNFDYSTQTYTKNGVTGNIPPAPNSGGAAGTHGVKMAANKNDAVAATAMVQIYAKDKVFANNYALRFDMWINYNGGAYGGTGSTEFGIFGINHTGTEPNWLPDETPTSGTFFAVTGEAGASGDYRGYEGFADGPTLRIPTAELFLDHDDNGTPEDEALSTTPAGYGLDVIFPLTDYETRGVPGKRWVQVEVRQVNGVISWIINRVVIARRDNTSGAWQQGTVMLGTMDSFASVANPKGDNYVIFDNVRVVDLANDPEKPQLTVTASDKEVIEPDNHGEFLIKRTGDTALPLTVKYVAGGTATSGTDYTAFPGTLTIPAGSDTLSVPVEVINDQFGETAESVQLTLTRDPSYEIVGIISKLDILDDGDVPLLSITPVDPVAFEGLPNESASVKISRVGDINIDLNVKLAITGSAASGTDFEAIQTPVLLPSGAESVVVKINALGDAIADDNETVIATIAADPSYTVGANNSATVTIREASSTFADNFDSDTSANYNILFGAVAGADDYQAAFGYDFSGDADVKPSPSGSTRGLKMTVNKDEDPQAAAVNAFPKGQSFSGNYLMKFDMFLTFDPSSSTSTEHALFGIGHSGTVLNRHGLTGDGVRFSVETDGSNQTSRGGTYGAYDSGTIPIAGRSVNDFTTIFPLDPYLVAGSPSGMWVDVSVLSYEGRIYMKINDNSVFDLAAPAGFGAGDIMLGYADSFNSLGPVADYVIYDNLKVYRIGTVTEPPSVRINRITKTGEQVHIQFTPSGGPAAGFDVYRSSDVAGTFVRDGNATITSLGDGSFDATVTGSEPAQFFLIRTR